MFSVCREVRTLIKKYVASIKNVGITKSYYKAYKYLQNRFNYNLWLKRNRFNAQDYEKVRGESSGINYKPLISIILPVYNIEEKWLRKCLDSVLNQVYENWELCIADDASDKTHVRNVLEEYQARDKRIKVVYRSVNGHIAAASNSALELASGEFIALLDHDDELAPDALFENVVLLNKHPDADMIYSDEDKIDENGRRHSPYFKPDWSPDTFLTQMYTGHLGFYRAELLRTVGGFRIGFEGSQDYDLVLRVTERTKNIYHIPKVLYHWRTLKSSSAMNIKAKEYAYVAAKKAIQEALDRRSEGGVVDFVNNYPGHYLVSYPFKAEPSLSVVIPAKDNSIMTGQCLESIIFNGYDNLQIIIVDNGSVEKETDALYRKWGKKENVYLLEDEEPFNFSRLINKGAAVASGDIFLFLNNDVKLITEDFLKAMVGYALRESIGAVGAMLLYSDDTIQHAGVILGIRGPANHSHRGLESTAPGYCGRLLSAANYSAVTGACMMVEKKLFNLVGGFDEELSVAYNDVDFCLKLLEKGYYNVVLPYVRAYHYESHTRGSDFEGEKRERLLKEAAIMQKRWHKYIARDPFYNPNLTLEKEDFSIRV